MPPSAASTSVPLGDGGEGCGPPQLFQRRQRGLELPDQLGGGIELGSVRSRRGSERCSVVRARRGTSSAHVRVRPCRASAAARAAPRVPALDTAAASNRHSGCLSSASSVTGGKPSSAASATAARTRRPACRPAHRRRNRRPARSSAPAPPARGEPARGRRHQRRGLARRLHRFAQRDGDRQRFLLGIGGLDHATSPSRHRRGRRIRFGQRSLQSCSPWRAAVPPTLAARGRAARRSPSAVTASRTMPMRCSSAAMANCGWPCAASRRRWRCPSTSRRRDRCRGRAAPARRAAARRWWRAVSRSTASSPSSPPRSPGR